MQWNVSEPERGVAAVADVADVQSCWLLHCVQGAFVANGAGSFKPAITISGMTAGMELHLDDLEVRHGLG